MRRLQLLELALMVLPLFLVWIWPALRRALDLETNAPNYWIPLLFLLTATYSIFFLLRFVGHRRDKNC